MNTYERIVTYKVQAFKLFHTLAENMAPIFRNISLFLMTFNTSQYTFEQADN